MTQLAGEVSWKRVPVGAGAAVGSVELAIGTVGQGSPVALITAGIHGDEGPWGAWAIRKLLDQVPIEELRGTLRVIPVANPLAMETDSRNALLDTLDLNRVFPGDPNGSHTERLAAAIVSNAVEGADVVIDLHGGGSWCVNNFVFEFPGSEPLARAIGAPFRVRAPDRSVTLTGYARTRGARVTAVERGGRSPHEAMFVDQIAAGLRRVLAAVGVVATAPDEAPEARPVGPTHVLRPTRGGIFRPRLTVDQVGTIIPQGELMGEVLDPVTFDVVERFEAPYAQTAVLLLRPTLARVEGGAMTYVVAEPE